MDKALQMGKSSATGSFHLLIGVVASSVIMAVGTLVLAALLSSDALGLYGVALIPASMINFFRDLGVNSAMTQQIAALRSSGRDSEIRKVIVSGTIFELIGGVVLSLACVALSGPLAIVLQRSEVANLIAIYSLSIFTGAVIAATSAIFIGYERMWLNSSATIIQSVVKTALGPFLVIIGFSVLGAIIAATVSVLAGAVVSFALVYFKLYRYLKKEKIPWSEIAANIKSMLNYGVPLSISNLVVGLLPQAVAFLMAVYASNPTMGNYYAATYFNVVITFVSFPIATALFPAFSKLDPKKERSLLQTVFATSVKYTSLLMIPVAMIMITLATPIVNTLFPADGIFNSLFVIGAAPKFPYAAMFLALSSLISLLPLFGTISLGTFQTGIRETNQIMKQSILSLAISLPATYFLIIYLKAIGGEAFAVVGGIIGILLSCLPGPIWGLYWSWKKYGVKANFRSSGKIFIAAIIASIVTFVFTTLVSLPYFILLGLGFVLYVVVYLITAPLIGAVNQADIDNFRTMFSGLGIVSRILNLPLLLMRKLCRENGYNKV
jgi:O-antigen/teichoic acid export membrane protein